jgi:hypothetical protein
MRRYARMKKFTWHILWILSSCVSGNASTNCKSRQSTEWDTRPKIVSPRVRTVTVRKDIMCSAARDSSLFRSPLITESRNCHRSNEDRPQLSLSSTKERLWYRINVSQYAKSNESTHTDLMTQVRPPAHISPLHYQRLCVWKRWPKNNYLTQSTPELWLKIEQIHAAESAYILWGQSSFSQWRYFLPFTKPIHSWLCSQHT